MSSRPTIITTPRFEKLTPKEQEVFGLVAINQDLGHNERTLSSLVRKGYLEEFEQVIRQPGQLPLIVKRYEVPIPVHIRWCNWCSENFDDKGDPIQKRR